MRTSRLRLEFAPGRRPASLAGRLMLGCGAALLMLALFELGSAVDARRTSLAALAELEARQALDAGPRRPAAKPDPAYLAKVKSARLIARSLTTPWAELLDSIESAPQQSVALLAVEPSTSKQSVRLTAEARDPEAMLGYLAALQKDSRLVSVLLLSHQLQIQTPGMPIRFQLQAQWGAAP
jgi:Tfp pilus assembly protein PilN